MAQEVNIHDNQRLLEDMAIQVADLKTQMYKPLQELRQLQQRFTHEATAQSVSIGLKMVQDGFDFLELTVRRGV